MKLTPTDKLAIKDHIRPILKITKPIGRFNCLITIIMVILKLFSLITISWLMVFLPIIINISIVGLLFLYTAWYCFYYNKSK